MLEQLLADLVADYLSKSASFRIGSFEISASWGPGAPHHLTGGEVLTAVVAAISGHTGTFAIGDLTLTVGPFAPAPAAAAPAAAAAS